MLMRIYIPVWRLKSILRRIYRQKNNSAKAMRKVGKNQNKKTRETKMHIATVLSLCVEVYNLIAYTIKYIFS